MGHLDKSGIVHAPPAAVYRYVADLHNAPHYIGAIQAITNGPAGSPAVGQVFHAAARFMGHPEQITLRLLTLIPEQQVSLALDGDPAATLTIRLTPDLDGTATHTEIRLDTPDVATLLLKATMGRMPDESIRRLDALLRGT